MAGNVTFLPNVTEKIVEEVDWSLLLHILDSSGLICSQEDGYPFKAFCGFLQSLQTNSWPVPQSRPQLVPFIWLPIYHSILLPSDSYKLDYTSGKPFLNKLRNKNQQWLQNPWNLRGITIGWRRYGASSAVRTSCIFSKG